MDNILSAFIRVYLRTKMNGGLSFVIPFLASWRLGGSKKNFLPSPPALFP